MSLQAVSRPSSIAAPRAKTPWRLAILLALAATVSGILLTGVSAWFLGAVALAGLGPAALVFNFHIPSAFVRLFALTKTLGKYGERVVGHRAALLDQVRRRAALLMAMAQAPSIRAAGWQFGNQDRLSDYIDDVEDVDYARLRVGMPALVLIAGVAALTMATGWLAPLALPPIAALAGTVLLKLYLAMPRLKQRSASARDAQRSAGRQLGTALAAVVPLQAERNFSNSLGLAFTQFKSAENERLAQRRSFAWLDMLAGLAGPLAALSVLAAAWHGGSRDSALLIAAFLAFGWLALGETAQGISRMVLGRVRENAARDGLNNWTGAGVVEAERPASPPSLQNLVLTNVPRLALDGRRLGEVVNLTFQAGRPTALIGASGAGKTTLLKQIAGWIGNEHDGRYTSNNAVLLIPCRRAISHLCLHDAAILSDTIRENLFAPKATDAACWQALAAVELVGRVEAAGGLDAWVSQDMLSLGEAQRLNLARTLLSKAPLVLLDEPVEHLDQAQAARILKLVMAILSDRVVVYSSHDEPADSQAAQIAL
jgi:ATP-binding cassette, subfamily C, bacterial CydC